MFDFIPIQLYTPIYFYVLLIVVMITVLHTYTLSINSSKTIRYNHNFGIFIFLFILLYMGLRPIHGVFIDMTTYARQFNISRSLEFNLDSFSDPLYTVFIYISSKLVSINFFFLLCSFLYILPIYKACKKWFREYWFYGFLILVSTLTFWSYGVNGIRNGIATSLFILAMSRDSLRGRIFFFIISIGFHKSMLLPLLGYFLAFRFKINIKYFFILWLVSIPLSLLGGGVWEQLFASLGFDDERLNYLTTEVEEGKFSRSGFRWDFLLFSTLPVICGYYYSFVKQYRDRNYYLLLSTYLFANSFWILVIRANFSNRFAYLSWFIMALVIIYPLLKQKIVLRQHQRIGFILLVYFFFTFLMNVILNFIN